MEEEPNSVVRYLTPEFQNPTQVQQPAMLEAEDEIVAVEVREKRGSRFLLEWAEESLGIRLAFTAIWFE